MSYCRWSDNDFGCDLYAYYGGPGVVTIHVAVRRFIFDVPLPPVVSLLSDPAGFFRRHEAVSKIRDTARREKIGLPCDGESYDLPLREAAAKVRELIAMGYHCDPAVATALDEEADDDGRTQGTEGEAGGARPDGTHARED